MVGVAECFELWHSLLFGCSTLRKFMFFYSHLCFLGQPDHLVSYQASHMRLMIAMAETIEAPSATELSSAAFLKAAMSNV